MHIYSRLPAHVLQPVSTSQPDNRLIKWKELDCPEFTEQIVSYELIFVELVFSQIF